MQHCCAVCFAIVNPSTTTTNMVKKSNFFTHPNYTTHRTSFYTTSEFSVRQVIQLDRKFIWKALLHEFNFFWVTFIQILNQPKTLALQKQCPMHIYFTTLTHTHAHTQFFETPFFSLFSFTWEHPHKLKEILFLF